MNTSSSILPIKQTVSLEDGLPKKNTRELILELKQRLFADDFTRFFPDDKKAKYQANFALFDRDNDKQIDLGELKELLTSLDVRFPEDELTELYNEYLKYIQETVPDSIGIDENAVYIIVSKKLRENDKEEQLTQAFKLVENAVNEELAKIPNENREQEGYIRVEQFKELLMLQGNRWSEEQCVDFLKDIDPKNEGRINYFDIVKKLMKR
ncbi:hypothetical protein IMG5_162880 [Ichthyophthirius multifiliis]|uniref:Calmodulin n=1 Tax=Ichthyophthirius multifiliis TaxID=5932 RepID=G0R096_ICHMU|nr:hypothetical protein IMG5_162880 [Ichthyophthirius multifiliis]EGR29104.1 hypothetical protein IMG5_162880 [Ichthyophthirius multifiliis]|eukprot:XP_004030340.1 hypothetical protein IMG5_162880 [Ichthyophthirius multifiliis]